MPFREDFPDAGAMQESYFTLATGHGEAIQCLAPVQFTIVKPGETLLGDDEAETCGGRTMIAIDVVQSTLT